MDEPTSLKHAVADSYAVFAVTNFWEKGSATVEVAQGESRVPTPPSPRKPPCLSGVRFRAAAEFSLTAKPTSRRIFGGLPITSVFFMARYFMQNVEAPRGPKPVPNGDGTLTLRQTWTQTSLIPLIDIRDAGK